MKGHEYCMKLISKIVPEGFILHPGFNFLTNTKLEDFKAMVSAVTGEKKRHYRRLKIHV